MVFSASVLAVPYRGAAFCGEVGMDWMKYTARVFLTVTGAGEIVCCDQEAVISLGLKTYEVAMGSDVLKPRFNHPVATMFWFHEKLKHSGFLLLTTPVLWDLQESLS